MMGSRFLNNFQTSSQKQYFHKGFIDDSPPKKSSPFNQHFDIYSNHQVDTILKNNFIKTSYPIDFTYANPFCPICGKFVSDKMNFLAYESKSFNKKFFAHEECLQKQDFNCLNAMMEDVNEAKITAINFLNHKKGIALGGRQFFVQLSITHPLSGYSFLKLHTKLKTLENLISWDLRNIHETDSYFPNIICFPIPDFELTIHLSEMAVKENKIKIKTYINLSKLKLFETKMLKATTDEVELSMKLIHSQEDKLSTINQMNFKYKYPLQINFPLIELYKLQIKLPSGYQSDDEEKNEISSNRNSSIAELLNEKTSQTSKSSNFYQKMQGQYNNEALSERSFDKEKVDLDRLISSKVIGEYVRNNNQSRVFQNYLNEAVPEEVDRIIEALYEEMPELITHQYANYMVQKLFNVCSMAQRMKIIDRLLVDVPTIVRNKQGTHTIQTLITLFTSDEEYKSICNSIRTSFYQLSSHPNATHFIQKIINFFPIAHTLEFFHFVNQNFISFAVDKNAMCVIKHMLRKIKEVIDNNHKSLPIILEVKKHFINSVTFNIDKIIQDAYGNYILQFCYQLFGENNCSGITEMIIQRFCQFSIQKYSSSVVFKCINSYWHEKVILERLRHCLSSESIQEMYRNKDGNKIVLEIMQKYESSPLREKVYGVLMSCESTKFYGERWGVVLGSRSGTVGSQWTSFTEAVKKSPNKKKKYYHNIH